MLDPDWTVAAGGLLLVVALAGCGDGAKGGASGSARSSSGPVATMSGAPKPPSASAVPSAAASSAARPGESPEALFTGLRAVLDVLDNSEDCPKMKAATEAFRTRYPADALEGMAKRLIMEPDDPGPKRRGNDQRLAEFKAAHPVEVGELRARHEAQKKRFADLHKECAELETVLSDVGVLLSIVDD